MARTPKWKVYRDGAYVAACKFAEDAAVLVAVTGGEIRADHAAKYTVWREGQESQSAAESYDHVANVMHRRLAEINAAAYMKAYGKLPDGYEGDQS